MSAHEEVQMAEPDRPNDQRGVTISYEEAGMGGGSPPQATGTSSQQVDITELTNCKSKTPMSWF